MRTEEGDEIIEPGDYELDGGRRLRVYVTQDDDEELHLWACTHCQEIDGMTNGLLVGVIDGNFDIRQDAAGEFQLRLTDAGTDAAKALIQRLATGEPEQEIGRRDA